MSLLTTNGMAFEKIILTSDTTKQTMDRKDLLILHNAGVVRRINEKKVFHVTDVTIKYVYFLQKGLIKISNISETGEELIKYFIKPGAIFGELNLLDNEEDRHEIAIALENSEVCFIPVETVKQLMVSNNSLRKSIHQCIGQRIKKMEKRMNSLMLKGVKERIMDFLKEFVIEFGHPVNGGYTAKNFLTHEDIARVTATSRQSVTTSLVHLKKHGLIDYDTQRLCVFNIKHS
jgi:CRP/FNR family transcriptional regulator